MTDEQKANRIRLNEAIDAVVARKIKHKKDNVTEDNVKSMYVDPILVALGWNIHEQDEVEREFKSQSKDKPVDYALKIDELIKLFIEAKKTLHSTAEYRQHLGQVLGYINMSGIRHCVLTDGDKWNFYDNSIVADAQEKIIHSISLVNDDRDMVIQILELISPDGIRNNRLSEQSALHQVQTVLKSAIDNKDVGLIDLIQAKLQDMNDKIIGNSLGQILISSKNKTFTIDDTPQSQVVVADVPVVTRKSGSEYSKGEEALIKEWYPKKCFNEEKSKELFPDRTYAAIKRKASSMNLKKNVVPKDWKPKSVKELKTRYKRGDSMEVLLEAFPGRTKRAIFVKAHSMGFKRPV